MQLDCGTAPKDNIAAPVYTKECLRGPSRDFVQVTYLGGRWERPNMSSVPNSCGSPGPDQAANVPGSHRQPPELRLIYDTAPIGLAFLSPDCRYLQINQRLTEICGISVADHLGRSVRETVPQVADQVEKIVQLILSKGEAITGIEVNGQRPDGSNAQRFWLTSWHPLRGPEGAIVGINVVAEEITERKRAEAALAMSEARFRELADNVSQFAWTADQSGWIYWYNKRWHDYTGTTLEEMQGWGWQKVHHPDHVDRVVQRIRQCFESGTSWEDTFPLRGRDGSYRWFLSRALPIRNEAAEVIRWFGTNTDVSEQIVAEKALRDLNETLEQRVETEARERARIWNVSQDLLVVADAEGRFLSVNPAWAATLGWSEAELLGNTTEWILHPDDRKKTRAEHARLAEGRRTLRFENRLRHKRGNFCWLSWTAVPDRGLIYAVARDITELKEAEAALQRSQRELARASRQITMGAMTASIAHEINQPLSAIVLNGNAALRFLSRPEPDLEAVRAALIPIVEDGHRAGQVIASVRAMFGKDAGDRTELDLNGLLRQVLAIAHGELESHLVSLQIDLADRLPQILGDRVPLQQVFLNLIMNAVEAMATVSNRPRVLSASSESDGTQHVLIKLQDSGAGIDPNDMGRIFEAFFTTKSNGMGMGLAICRSIVEAHGGRLWASAAIPHGSIFHVVLPGAIAAGGQ
jgi:PAS domain S-box-containing protein